MSDVDYEIRGQVVWIRIDRPETMNALSRDSVAGFSDALDPAKVEGATRVDRPTVPWLPIAVNRGALL